VGRSLQEVAKRAGPLELRPARDEDCDAIARIYNDAVLKSPATFDLTLKSTQDFSEYIAQRKPPYCVCVADRNGVAGFAALSPLFSRAGYANSTELTVYVGPDTQCLGVGRALAKRLVEEAQRSRFHTIVCFVTHGNFRIVRILRELGFHQCGVIADAGNKFGFYFDLDVWQLLLN
jgi:phosphinothricin acetyltransferase